jgi:hypothetical protein
MSKKLPVPPELQHLLEKREQEKDRRKDKAPAADVIPEAGADAASETERRQKSDRRRKRKSGS